MKSILTLVLIFIIGALNAQKDLTKSVDSEVGIGANHKIGNKNQDKEDSKLSYEENKASQEKKDKQNNFVLESKYLNDKLSDKELKEVFKSVSNTIDSLNMVRKSQYVSRLKSMDFRMTELKTVLKEDKSGKLNVSMQKEISNLKESKASLQERLQYLEKELQIKNRELILINQKIDGNG